MSKVHVNSWCGKLASAWCKANELPVGKAKHPIYGEINSYPYEALVEVFGD